MAYNGSGSFTIDTAGNPVVYNTTIDEVSFNATMTEIATGLSTAICKDGQTTITANIPMNSKKFTGLADGSARADSANIGNIVDGTGVYVGTVGGTADVITLTPNPAITAYVAGQTFRFIASGANTTNVTVAISGLAAKAITKNGTTALVAGDIPASTMVEITYDGTRFILGTIGAALAAGAIQGTIVDAKGDVLTATAADTPARLAVGTNTHVLSADSAEATGLKWVDATTVVSAASESAAGKIELATQAEVNAMTDTTRALTPNHNQLVLAAMVASTSGTSIDFTSIPAGVRRILVMYDGTSMNATAEWIVQIGDSGGIETTGYLGSAIAAVAGGASAGSTPTNGFGLLNVNSSAVAHGIGVLTLMDVSTNLWSWGVSIGLSNAGASASGGGTKSLSAVLDRVRLTTIAGTATFDAGNVCLCYER
jgi:hypothetical protein